MSARHERTKDFYLTAKCFLLNNVLKINSREVHLSDPYCKIQTAQGTNQNAPFHRGPVCHIITMKVKQTWTPTLLQGRSQFQQVQESQAFPGHAISLAIYGNLPVSLASEQRGFLNDGALSVHAH